MNSPTQHHRRIPSEANTDGLDLTQSTLCLMPGMPIGHFTGGQATVAAEMAALLEVDGIAAS